MGTRPGPVPPGPAVSTAAGSDRGHLHLGLPASFGVDPGGGWDERWIEPVQGTLFLMPAYMFHGTSPLGEDDERISIAFDVIPTEVAPRRSPMPRGGAGADRGGR